MLLGIEFIEKWGAGVAGRMPASMEDGLPASTAAPAQHDLIAIGIFAHGKVGRFSVFPLRFPFATTACRHNFRRTLHNIGHLESKAGPGLPALTASVDGNHSAGDGNFRDVGILAHDPAAETICVKSGCALRIGCPDGVFELLNDHGIPHLHREAPQVEEKSSLACSI